MLPFFFFFSSRRRHTRWTGDWSSDVCSSDLRSERMPGSDEQAAVTAEHQRDAGCVELIADARGQPPGVVDDRALVARSGDARLRVIDVTAGEHDPGVDGAASGKAVVQPGLAQCLGGLRGAGHGAGLRRAQSEVRRRGDQGQHAGESSRPAESLIWSYIAGMLAACRPGSSQGNQIAARPAATSAIPTAWPNGFPWRQSFSTKMTAARPAMTATFIT